MRTHRNDRNFDHHSRSKLKESLSNPESLSPLRDDRIFDLNPPKIAKPLTPKKSSKLDKTFESIKTYQEIPSFYKESRKEYENKNIKANQFRADIKKACCQELNIEIDELKIKLKEKDKIIESIKNMNSTFIEDLKIQSVYYREIADDRNIHISEYRNKINHLQSVIKTKNKEIDDLQLSILDFSKDLKCKEKEKKISNIREENLEKSLKKLNRKIIELLEEGKILKEENFFLNTELAKNRSQAEENDRKYKDLENLQKIIDDFKCKSEQKFKNVEKKLVKDLENLNFENEMKDQIINKLEFELQKMNIKNKEIMILLDKKSEKYKEIKKVKEELKKKIAEIRQMKEKIDESGDSTIESVLNPQLKDKLTQLLSENNILKEKLENLEKESILNHSQNLQLSEENTKNLIKIKQMRDEIMRLSNYNNQLLISIGDLQLENSRLNEYRIKFEILQKQENLSESKYLKLKNDYSSISLKLKEIDSLYTEVNTKNEELKIILNRSNTEKNLLQEEIFSLKEKILILELNTENPFEGKNIKTEELEEIMTLKSSLIELTIMNQTINKEFSDLQIKNSKNEVENKNLVTRVVTAENQLQIKDLEIKSLKFKLSDFENELHDEKCQVEERLRKQLEEEKGRNDEKEIIIIEKENQMRKILEQLLDLENSLDEQKIKNNQLLIENLNLESTNNEMKCDVKYELLSKETLLREKSKEIESFQQKHIKLSKENERLQEKLAIQIASHEKMILENSKESENLRNKLESVDIKYENLLNQVENSEIQKMTEINKLKHENKKLSNELESIKNQPGPSKSENSFKVLIQEIDSIKRTLIERNEEISERKKIQLSNENMIKDLINQQKILKEKLVVEKKCLIESFNLLRKTVCQLTNNEQVFQMNSELSEMLEYLFNDENSEISIENVIKTLIRNYLKLSEIFIEFETMKKS